MAIAIAGSAVAAVISQHTLHALAPGARIAWGWLVHLRANGPTG